MGNRYESPFQKKKKKRVGEPQVLYWSTSSVLACVLLMISTLHVEKRVLLHSCFGLWIYIFFPCIWILVTCPGCRRALSVLLVNRQRNGLRVTHDINPSCGKENFTSLLFWSLNIFFSHVYEFSLLVQVVGEPKCSYCSTSVIACVSLMISTLHAEKRILLHSCFGLWNFFFSHVYESSLLVQVAGLGT